MKKFQSIRLLLGAAVLLPGLVQAENTLQPFVSITTVQDNNLYRLDSSVDETSLPSTLSKSDTIYQTAVGLNLDWTVSRQQFVVNASMTDSRFDKNENLDNMQQNLNARWNWLVGSHVTGQLGASHKSKLADFGNTVTLDRSIQTTQNLFLNSNWRFHPDWQVGFGLAENELNYDSQEQKVLQQEDSIQSVNVDYLANSGSRVGLKFIQQDSKQPNAIIPESGSSTSEFEQQSMLLTTLWAVTGKSKLNGEVGMVSRHYKNQSTSNYDALNFKVDYDWVATGQLLVNLGAYQRATDSQDELSSARETTGVNLSANWLFSDKVTFNSRLNQSVSDRYVTTGLVTSDTVKEIYSGYSLGVSYQPHHNFDIGLNYAKSQRESEQLLRDYDADSITLSLTITL